MASAHVVVIDTSFRRAMVKVTPGKYMTDVLEEACAKLGLKSSQYGIKNNNKPVDVSRTFRQTGLSSGAKLELIIASRSPSVVSVALQLPQSLASAVPGGRLVDKFPSDTTLWLILRKFESFGVANLNFTARGATKVESGTSGAGRIVYEMPVLNIMGRELSTFGDLQKTLGQLGFNGGSTLIRLDFKTTEQPLEEAMSVIGQYFQEETPVGSAAAKTKASQPAATATITDAIAKIPSAEAQANGDVEMTTEDTTGTITASEQVNSVSSELGSGLSSHSEQTAPSIIDIPTKEIAGPNERPIAVYSAPSSDTPVAALQPHNDNDYEPTIAHAKLHQSRLLNNSQNKRLLSDAETEQIEKDRAAKLAATKQVSIKIRFPDQSSIVSPFMANETGAHLYKYVRDVIAAGDQPFKLVWTSKGPQTVPDDHGKLLIKDLKFEGRMLVNFLWEDGASDVARKNPVLKKEFAEAAKELAVPVPLAVEADEDSKEPSTTVENAKPKDAAGQRSKGGTPKWLKGLVKK